MTIEQAMEKVGYNTLYIVMISAAYMANNMFHSSFSYFEKIPALECNYDGVWEPCTKKQACSFLDRDKWRVDYEDEYTFTNMITQNDWVCLQDY